jgi:hypothetical protein
VHGEVRKEEVAVKYVRALKKRHGDRNLAVGRHRLQKKRTQGDGGSQKKLAATCRVMTRRAIPAWRQGQGQDNAARGAPKGQTFGKKRRA